VPPTGTFLHYETQYRYNGGDWMALGGVVAQYGDTWSDIDASGDQMNELDVLQLRMRAVAQEP
jgi:hypothetical protein